ncbi:Vacuolar protein-sorting-associated protein 33 [Coemansia spiralis]|uniref:Vacuolar protein-sorting-associated protein 33 n=2 Tax=Coemansia TaxID=4863 RepID=A0A9W8KX12_9FUNG|nr:Vacuolar protein-sorting-associated protein 33 [Coemansia umbellata]KAJ2620879.1 Vacuolar protein-sorting-associated protein 33 [Coemansia sp. RSA 1358]KAJ2675452.1 Vacuolar protein-sorting-associated protein 33 [Coemansia spiralis]
MQTTGKPSPESTSEPNILQLKEILRDELIRILDSIRGSKALVLDKEISGALSMIVDFGLLKEHGVEKVFLLESGPLDTGAIKGVLYFTLPHVRKMKLIAEQVRAGLQGNISGNSSTGGIPKEYSLQLVPRRTLLCERVLEEEGVLGDISIGEYHMDFIPLEDDVLSLELPATFKELYLDGDFSAVQYTARALMRLQGLFGFFPRIVGKGDFAQILADSLTRMRLELMSTGLNGGVSNNALAMSSVFDSVVIIDRAVDLATPLLTQLTYEGLISEVFGINDGSIALGGNANTSTAQNSGDSGGSTDAQAAGKRKRVTLNSTDTIYHEIRNLNFSSVGSLLSKLSRRLQDSYESRHKAKTVQEIRSFVGKLGGLQSEHQSLKVHVSLAETILKRTQSDDFSTILEIEQTLVGGGDLSREQLAYFDKLFALADPHAPVPGVDGELKGQIPPVTMPNSIHKVLRLLCLYSLWRGSHFKQKMYESWYEEVIAGFGYHHIITLANLSKVGLLLPPSSAKSAAASSSSAQRLTSGASTSETLTTGLLNSVVPSTKPRNPVHTNPLGFLRKTLNLVVSDVRENDPDDIAFVYSGYAPISIRLLQCLVRDPAVYASGSSSRYSALLRPLGDNRARPAQRDGQNMGGMKGGWGGWDDVLSELPGETVDIIQSPNDHSTDTTIADEMVRRLGEKTPATLVVFLGGCTFTEIAALRLLSQQHNHRYIVATTQIINGNTFLDPLIQRSI